MSDILKFSAAIKVIPATLPGSGETGEIRLDISDSIYKVWDGAFWVEFGTAAATAPVLTGVVLAYAAPTAPSGYLICDGTAVSRATFDDLFALIGITHGEGDGSTTFDVPDYRGRFLRGLAAGSGRDPDRLIRGPMSDNGNTGDSVGSVQGGDYLLHGHPWRQVNETAVVNDASGGAIMTDSNSPSHVNRASNTGAPANSNTQSIGGDGGNETRPVNAYVQYIIKT